MSTIQSDRANGKLLPLENMGRIKSVPYIGGGSIVAWPSFPKTCQCCLLYWKDEITLWPWINLKGKRKQRDKDRDKHSSPPEWGFLWGLRGLHLTSLGRRQSHESSRFHKICKWETFKLQWLRWPSLSTLIPYLLHFPPWGDVGVMVNHLGFGLRRSWVRDTLSCDNRTCLYHFRSFLLNCDQPSQCRHDFQKYCYSPSTTLPSTGIWNTWP